MAKKTTTRTTTSPTVKLTRHKKGWVAKIGGKVRWLAPLHSPELAKQRYFEKAAEFRAGQPPAVVVDSKISLSDLFDLFLDAKAAAVRQKDLAARTYADYRKAAQDCADYFGAGAAALGLHPGDWARYRAHLAQRLGPFSLQRYVVSIRAVSRWATRNEILDRPVRFGDSFDPPEAAKLRKARRGAGPKLFTPAQVAAVLAASPQPIRAMFLLSLNAGFGNTDVARLPLAAAHLDRGIIEFDRPKTGVERRCPLWPETVAALREVLARRREPKNPDNAPLLFLTPEGHPFVRDKFDAEGELTSTTDAIGMGFGAVCKAAGVPRTFYDGRRTFRTTADECGDQRAIALIMGHQVTDMGGVYVQGVSLERLKAVTDHVRSKLLPGT